MGDVKMKQPRKFQDKETFGVHFSLKRHRPFYCLFIRMMKLPIARNRIIPVMTHAQMFVFLDVTDMV